MRPVEEILATHGIFPVTRYEDRELDQCFSRKDQEATLKHFDPR